MIDDLAWAAGRDAALALASRLRSAGLPADAVDDDPGRSERIHDHLRRDNVAEALRRLDGDGEGEEARPILRALVAEWLRRGTVEVDRELAERRAEHDEPRGGWETALALEDEPSRREAILGRWCEIESRLAPTYEARRQARDEAARRVGARDAVTLLGLCEAGPRPEVSVRLFERGAVEPLDDAVARSCGVRRRRPADEARRRSGAALPDAVARGRIRDAVRRAAASAGADPDLGLLQLVTGVDDRPWSELTLPGEAGPPAIVEGVLDGPVAAWRSLASTGEAVRAAFHAGRPRFSEARFADPAFIHAARTLWRRLALCDEARGALGLAWSAAAAVTVRREEALVPRLAWAYLSLAVEPGETEESRRRLERAGSVGGWPGVSMRGDVGAASVLRGTSYGLLLEERLLTRFGRGWFEDRGALRFLREAWDAEPGETVERLAAELDVGTIDGSPIVDRCRPE